MSAGRVTEATDRGTAVMFDLKYVSYNLSRR
jgi:hypothetical protein